MSDEDLRRNERIIEYYASYPRKDAGAEDRARRPWSVHLPTVAEAASGATQRGLSFAHWILEAAVRVLRARAPSWRRDRPVR